MNKKTFSISEAISFGWNTFKSNWKFWIVATLIVGMSTGSPGLSSVGNLNKSSSTQTSSVTKTLNQDLPYPPYPVDFDKVLGVSHPIELDPPSIKQESPISNSPVLTLIPYIIVAFILFLAVGVVGVLISIVFRMGYINLTLDAVRNKDIYYKTILNQVSLKKAWRFLIAGLRVLLIMLPFILLSLVPLYIILSVYFIEMLMSYGGWSFSDLSPSWPIYISWFLLFFIPGIILALKYSMVPFVLVDLDKTPSEAMKISSKLTKNVRFKVLKFWFVSCLVMMLGLLAFGVGVIPASIVISLAYAYVYNKLLEQSAGQADQKSTDIPLPPVNSGSLLAENLSIQDSLTVTK
jgi:hypothetical protein